MTESFLLVVPPGWTQLDWDFITGNTSLSFENVPGWISTNSLSYIEEELKLNSLIPQEASLVEAKLFDNTFFMVRLG